ncbi:HTH domain-containing protein [Alkalibacterium putridalgicola]|uniref:HTH domain-containing protein n=1 Tax=Alkalibacterium putridalgicola TaxID=426703 RepID=A0A1H7RLF9_9LACT|nr:HNH endonuclease [Alkalibacterium putridalgicola]GEK88898.1 hypothetical protein APU01nite_09370 [Alkalibacterium putridalgicola]SEL61150.1 HTH domain-containing protein [Alkalibacterium putridalgicola]
MPAKSEKQVLYSVMIGDRVFNVTGRKRNKSGYVLLCINAHPNSDVAGYIMEHRVVAESYLGRFLNETEVVHHKNEIKHDNRVANLKVLDRGEHTIYHHLGSRRSKETRNKMSGLMKQRLKNKKNHPSYVDVDAELKKLVEEGRKATYISKKLNISRKTVYNKIEYLKLGETYDKHSSFSR